MKKARFLPAGQSEYFPKSKIEEYGIEVLKKDVMKNLEDDPTYPANVEKAIELLGKRYISQEEIIESIRKGLRGIKDNLSFLEKNGLKEYANKFSGYDKKELDKIFANP